MKYFAKLGLNSKVIGFDHVGENNAATEQDGINYLNKLHSYPFWKEFKKDGSIRKNCALKGMIYDEEKDAFYFKENTTQWPSSVFNETDLVWEHPIPHPDYHKVYYWDEEIQNWVLGVVKEDLINE